MVVGISQSQEKQGKWMIYVKELDSEEEQVEIKVIEYSAYKSVCPEKIVDFFEKHLEFMATPNLSENSDSDKENTNTTS